MDERVVFRKSDTESPTWTVAALKASGQKVGDSFTVYQLKMTNGELYNNGEWVAQNRLEDP